MGLFRKEKTPHGATPATTKTRHQKPVHDPLSMSRRPSFGQWLKATWLDILTMAIMGAIGLGVSCNATNHSCYFRMLTIF
jgi:hypothetical protein